MLKNIPPLLSPSLLFGLAKMGHGDMVAVVDANFPADRIAQEAGADLVHLPGISSSAVLEALLSVLPIDQFETPSAWTMQVVGEPLAVPVPVQEFRKALLQQGEAAPVDLERFVFYAQARTARLIVQTGDLRKYANVLLRKGVIACD